MLRTNNKEVTKKVDQWLIDSYNDCRENYELKLLPEEPAAAVKVAAETFSNIFYEEKIKHNSCSNDWQFVRLYYNGSIYEVFKDWTQGLPSSLNCDYWLYREYNAKDVLKDWLQETEEEANRYSLEEASELVTRLLFKRINQIADLISNFRMF